jgi:hypothetical protein
MVIYTSKTRFFNHGVKEQEGWTPKSSICDGCDGENIRPWIIQRCGHVVCITCFTKWIGVRRNTCQYCETILFNFSCYDLTMQAKATAQQVHGHADREQSIDSTESVSETEEDPVDAQVLAEVPQPQQDLEGLEGLDAIPYPTPPNWSVPELEEDLGDAQIRAEVPQQQQDMGFMNGIYGYGEPEYQPSRMPGSWPIPESQESQEPDWNIMGGLSSVEPWGTQQHLENLNVAQGHESPSPLFTTSMSCLNLDRRFIPESTAPYSPLKFIQSSTEGGQSQQYMEDSYTTQGHEGTPPHFTTPLSFLDLDLESIPEPTAPYNPVEFVRSSAEDGRPQQNLDFSRMPTGRLNSERGSIPAPRAPYEFVQSIRSSAERNRPQEHLEDSHAVHGNEGPSPFETMPTDRLAGLNLGRGLIPKPRAPYESVQSNPSPAKRGPGRPRILPKHSHNVGGPRHHSDPYPIPSSTMQVIPKRKRIKQPCITCRKKKTRCSGERPECGTCLNNNNSCEGYA